MYYITMFHTYMHHTLTKGRLVRMIWSRAWAQYLGTNSTSLLIKEIGCPLLNIAHSQDAGQHTARHWAPIYLDATANFAYPASPQATGINGEAFNTCTLATNAYIAEPVCGKHRHQQQQASILLSLYQHNKHLTTRLATIAGAWTNE